MRGREMSRKLLHGLAVVAVAITATVATAGTAQARVPAQSGGATVSSTAELSPDVARTLKGSGIDARQQALAQYWTPERMKAAKPESEIPAVRAGAGARTPNQARTQPQGQPGQVLPSAPKQEPK